MKQPLSKIYLHTKWDAGKYLFILCLVLCLLALCGGSGCSKVFLGKSAADMLAEGGFMKAIDIDPRHVEARLLLSLLYADWGELQKAADQLGKVLEIDPTNARARKFLEKIEKKNMTSAIN